MQGNRQIGMPPFTPVIKNLIIINFLIWMAQSFLGANVTSWMDQTFALHSIYSPLFKPWQVITHMFMHSPFYSQLGIWHILLNMFGLWMFGSALEIQMGAKRFLSFYLISGVGAAIIYLGYLHFYLHSLVGDYQIALAGGAPQSTLMQYQAIINESMIGASGAIFGVIAGFGYLFPNTYLYIYFFLPLKTKWAVIGIIAYELYGAIANSSGDDVAHVAHLGGAFVGFLIIYFWNKKDRRHFY